MFNRKKRLYDTLNIANQTIEIHNDLGGTPLIILIVFGETCTATIATLGNFSMIIGRVKSRKTFYVSIAVADWVNKENNRNASRSLSPIYVPEVTHRRMLAAAFEENAKMKYGDLFMCLKLAYDKVHKLGDNKMKFFIKYAMNEKFLLQEGIPGTVHSALYER